jgi:hypothetical protein
MGKQRADSRSGVMRIGLALSLDAYKRLGELTAKYNISQSALLETLIWMLSDDDCSELAERIRSRLRERLDFETELRARLRRMSPEEARRVLAGLESK